MKPAFKYRWPSDARTMLLVALYLLLNVIAAFIFPKCLVLCWIVLNVAVFVYLLKNEACDEIEVLNDEQDGFMKTFYEGGEWKPQTEKPRKGSTQMNLPKEIYFLHYEKTRVPN